MKMIVIVILVGLLISFIITAFSFNFYFNKDRFSDSLNIYYISNDGNDSNDGLSQATPWKTISKVNSMIDLIGYGDDLYFRRGDKFTDTPLNIKIGGNSSDPMVIGAYGKGSKPIISNISGGIECASPNLKNVEIRDLRIEVSLFGIRFRQNNISDIAIINVEIDNCSNNGIILSQIDRYLIDNCTISNCSNSGIVILGSLNYPISNGLIRTSSVFNINQNDGITLHKDGSNNDIGSNHIIKGCVIWNCNEQAFDITSGENIYLKDCEGYNNGISTLVLGHNVRNVTIDNLFSHDERYMGVVITNAQNVIIRSSILSGSDYYIFNMYGQNKSDISENLKFYNNDVIFTNTTHEVTLAFYINDLNFKNNIFTSTGDFYPTRFFKITQGGNLSNRNISFNNNIWWRGDGGVEDDTWWYIDNPPIKINFTEWNRIDEVKNDLKIDPKMVVSNNITDAYKLMEGSPAIDNGSFHTKTIGSGSGSKIMVRDACYFCDGLGLIDGDKIIIGADSKVKIVDIDYNQNIIEVNKSISWDDGDNVSLLYYGSSPDIGAFEFTPDTSKFLKSDISNLFNLFFMTLFCFGLFTKKLYIGLTRKLALGR